MLNIDTSIYDDQGALKKPKKFQEIVKKQIDYSCCHGVVLYNEEDSAKHLAGQWKRFALNLVSLSGL